MPFSLSAGGCGELGGLGGLVGGPGRSYDFATGQRCHDTLLEIPSGKSPRHPSYSLVGGESEEDVKIVEVILVERTLRKRTTTKRAWVASCQGSLEW